MTIKVAVAAWSLGPSPSGARRRLLSTLEAMAPMLRSDEDVVVLYRPDDIGNPPAGPFRWIPVDIPAAPTLRRVLAERRQLPRVLDDLGVHVLELGTLPVPPKLPCRVSLTVHDLRDAHGWRRRRLRFLVRHLLRSSLRKVAHLVVPSEFTAHQLRTWTDGMLPPVEVIPNGVDESLLEITPQSAQRDGVGDRRPFFLHVGHLEPRKNLMLLMSAYAGLVADPQIDAMSWPALCFAGADHGSLAELKERAAMLEITSHVHFVGTVDDPTLHRLYASAAAVLLPSLHEGFGLPALESLAIGRPVLVSNEGALPEVVGKHGVVLPAEDASAWADAMGLIARQGGREPEKLVAARKEWASQFTWERAARSQLEVWRRVANEG